MCAVRAHGTECCCLLAVSPSLVRLLWPIPSLLSSRSHSLAMISCNTRPLLMRSVPDIDVHVPLPVPVHPPIRPSLVVLTLEFNLYCVDLVAPHPRYRLRTTYDIQYTTTTRPPFAFAFAFVTCPVRLCVFNVLPSRLSSPGHILLSAISCLLVGSACVGYIADNRSVPSVIRDGGRL